jgi:alcohol dehydrogenase (cytochrome c)
VVDRSRTVLLGLGLLLMYAIMAVRTYSQQTPAEAPTGCRIEAINFEGWQAQQVSNSSVKLVIVPQLGGRVMQVVFDGHPYLFINPKYKGQYLPPSAAQGKHRWFNYGGDKIWPMPEGDEDEHHWPGPISDPLDDGEYVFKILFEAPQCTVRLEGPPDPKTGLQYSREISLDSESPQIRFHALMKNIADHPIQWSMQSVTQYDTNNPQNPADYNREFWAFTPANPNSAYLERFHVRSGLADDPSFRLEGDLFSLHWLPLQNEVWLDSPDGWLAVADASSGYGMLERFRYFPNGEYPGKATVIFYKNGGSLTLDDRGSPVLTSSHPEEALRYMEAEINSPIISLAPGESYAMDTEWLPVRIDKHLGGSTLASAVRGLAPAAALETGKTAVSVTVDVQPQQMTQQPPDKNWLSYNGDYTGRRYSKLEQINVANVGKLRAQWVFHAPNSDSLEVTPVVVDGLMFITSANDAYALDSQTGRMIWHYSRPVTEGLIDDASQHHNRGVGIWHSRVYLETDNAHLLCLDARSGHLLWDVPYTDGNKNYGATSAPLVVKDKVLVGTSGGDDGVRGFLAAFDAESGKLAWRFWTIPAPGEPGSESWPGDAYLRGCGTTWMPGTYDPELNTLFWGTSNPCPDFDGDPRPGDDLYTDSVLALDPDTGKLKWHFQFTPHDLFDYDAAETAVLIDSTYKGKPRRLLAEANRNGFFYVLDRTDGQFLSAVRFAELLNWAKGIDAQGRPIRTDVEPTAQGTRVCPGFSGATNWYAPSYNPDTKFFYFLALEHCDLYFKKAEKFQEGQAYYSTGVKHSPGDDRKRILLAYDLESDKPAWRYPQVGNGHGFAGTMTTKGGLVFFGDDAQSFEAVDARTGVPLWHFNTGQNLHASPMSYAVNGKQYVAIAAGSDIFTFALP